MNMLAHTVPSIQIISLIKFKRVLVRSEITLKCTNNNLGRKKNVTTIFNEQ